MPVTVQKVYDRLHVSVFSCPDRRYSWMACVNHVDAIDYKWIFLWMVNNGKYL